MGQSSSKKQQNPPSKNIDDSPLKKHKAIDTSLQSQDIENQKSKSNKEYSVLDHKYEIMESLGDGHTSRVYLARDITKKTNYKVAIKVFKTQFIQNTRQQNAQKLISREIQILDSLDHPNINQLLDYGQNGKIIKPSGKVLDNIVYLVLEYVSNGIFFDTCRVAGAMGEDAGRYFMYQLADALSYLHDGKQVAHRDLKLDNILVDNDLNLVLADFGYATNDNLRNLTSYRGTKTYMAPEIKNLKEFPEIVYDGRKADIFSAGVILFVIVIGIFPFLEAKETESNYKLIMENKYSEYWNNFDPENDISNDFKQLVFSMFSLKPNDRPTISELKKHQWMDTHFNSKKVKQNIQNTIKQNKDGSTTDSSESS